MAKWKRVLVAALLSLGILQIPLGAAAPAAAATESVAVTGNTPLAVAGGQLTATGPTDPNTPLTLVLGLKPPNPSGVAAAAAAVQGGAAPLSVSQFAAQYAPSASSYDSVVSWLQGAGFTVGAASANNLLVTVTGTVYQAEGAFGVSINNYPCGSGTCYANAADPQVPSALAGLVQSVAGLDNFPTFKTFSAPAASVGPSVSTSVYYDANGFTPLGLQKAYDVLPILGSSITGTGQTVDIVIWNAINQSDVNAFDTNYSLPAITVNQIGVGGTPTVDFVSASSGSGEATLDAESVHSLAPGAAINMYEAVNSQFPSLEQAINEAIVQNSAHVVSMSWGASEGSLSPSLLATMDTLFAEGAAQGMTLIASSGDNGAFANAITNTPYVSYPASDPYVTAVGGTALNVDANGNYLSETPWNHVEGLGEGPASGSPPAYFGGGGGFSVNWPAPSWQGATVNGYTYNSVNYNSGNMRALPDISLDAGGGTAAYFNGVWNNMIGTSISAPDMAGLTALLDQGLAAASKPPVGYLDPTLYQAVYGTVGQSVYFHPITAGDICTLASGGAFPSGGTCASGVGPYYAAPGWNPATGLGSPDFAQLYAKLVGPGAAPPAPSITVTPPSVSTGYSSTALAVNGTNTHFDGTTTVTLVNSGTNYAAAGTLVSASVYSFQLNAGLTAGQYQVSVHDTTDGNLTAPLTVGLQTASVSPASLQPGYGSTTMNVTGQGTNFQNNSVTAQVVYAGNLSPAPGWSAPVNLTVGSVTAGTFTLATGLPPGNYDAVINDVGSSTSMLAPFTVTNPSLYMTGPPQMSPYVIGQNLTLSGNVSDVAGSVYGSVYYQVYGNSTWSSVTDNVYGSAPNYNFAAVIPGAAVTQVGLSVYVKFGDVGTGVLQTPVFPVGNMGGGGGAIQITGQPNFSPYTVGSNFTVTAGVYDSNPGATVTGAVYYQQGGNANNPYSSVVMTPTPGGGGNYSFTGTVPSAAVTASGLNFYLQFNDSTGATMSTPVSFVGQSQTTGFAPVTVQPTDPAAGHTTTYQVGFQIQNNLPSGGKIRLTFPSGFNLSSATVPSWYAAQMSAQPGYVSFTGSPVAGTDGNGNPTLSLTVGANVNGPNYLNFPVGGIVNGTVAGVAYQVGISTLFSSGAAIEGPYTSAPFTLVTGGTASISGTVSDGTTGLVGVAVYANGPGGMQTATSGGGGAYSLIGLNPGMYQVFTQPQVTVGGITYQGVPVPVSVNVPLSNSAVTGINLVLNSAASLLHITGTVNAPASLNGQTIGVFVGGPNSFGYQNVTIVGGTASFTIPVQPDATYMVGLGPQVPSPGIQPPPPPTGVVFPQPVTVPVGNSSPAGITLTVGTASATVSGWVYDGSGNPIPNAYVFAYNPAGNGAGNNGQTDSSGHFQLSIAPGNYMVGAGAPGLPPIPPVTVNVTNSGQTPAILVIKAPANNLTITGAVYDPNGNPIQGAQVFAYQVDGSGKPMPGQAGNVTDSSGNYTLYVSANTNWMVGAFAQGYGPLAPVQVAVVAGSVTHNLSYGGSSTATISGQVTVNGTGQTGINVFAQGTDGSGNFVGNGTVTDQSGNYSLRLPKNVTYQVQAGGPGLGKLPALTEGPLTSNITGASFAVQTGSIVVSLGGNVVNGFAGAMPVSASVYGGNGVPIQNQSSVTIPVPYGSYHVQVFIQGQGMVTASPDPAVVSSGTPVAVSIAAVTPVTVSGQVNVVGATVSVWSTTTTAGAVYTADSGGNFTFQLAPNQTYNMVATAPGYVPSAPATLNVVTSALTNQNITLTAASATVSGFVYLPGGAVLPGGGFVTATQNGVPPVTVPVSGNGNFSLALGAGTWTVSALANGYTSSSASVSGATSGVSLNLTASGNAAPPAQQGVTPSSGGTVQDSGGNSVNFGAGSLGSGSSQVQVVVQGNNGAPPSNNGTILSAVDVSASSGGESITNLNGTITITIPYDPAKVIDPTKLQIQYFNQASGLWVSIPTTVDTVNHLLIGTADHLTTYGENNPPGNTPSNNGGGCGCGGGGGPAPAPTPTTTNTSASGSIGTSGGTVATSDNSLSLTIPANAFSQSVTVSIQVVPTAQAYGGPSGGLVPVSSQWTIDAGGSQPGQAVTATFKYDASALNGLSPSRLGVYLFNPAANTWTWVGGVVDPSAGTITVTLPHFSIYAAFANTASFGDLAGADWAKPAIDALLGADILNGTAPGVFAPNGTLTRAQFTKLLVLAGGLTPGGTASFSDVAAASWYAPYVAAANAAGLVQGTSASTFAPNAPVTREQMAVMLARLLGSGASTGSIAGFNDSSKIDSWATSGVGKTIAAGLISGFPDGTFQPLGTATRAQAAQVVYKYLHSLGKD